MLHAYHVFCYLFSCCSFLYLSVNCDLWDKSDNPLIVNHLPYWLIDYLRKLMVCCLINIIVIYLPLNEPVIGR